MPVVLLVVMVLGVRGFLPYGEWLERGLSGFRNLGWRGALGVCGVVALGVMLCAPGSVLAVGTGFVLGFGWGFPMMWGGALLGAFGAFGLARVFFRDGFGPRVAGDPVVVRFEAALREGGWKLVALLRLTPVVPFFVLNYPGGSARMRPGAFLMGTGIAILPGTAVYVSLGAGARGVAGVSPVWGWEKWMVLAVGMLATVAAGGWARKVMCKNIPEASES